MSETLLFSLLIALPLVLEAAECVLIVRMCSCVSKHENRTERIVEPHSEAETVDAERAKLAEKLYTEGVLNVLNYEGGGKK